MADYPSLLTGAQMDSALLDVAQHNSEAWAVGTRNGYDVQSGDETFNNNSWYWARQAQTWAGVAQGAIPSGTAGAVFFDRAQSLTDAQKQQARANIAAGNSNRNLLDNPFFTVNQRGLTTYTLTGNAYIVDRWKSSDGNTITVSSNGISMASSTGTHQNLLQGMTTEEFNGIAGKVLTASVLTQSGALSTLTFTMPSSIASGSLANLGTMSIGGASFILYMGHAYSGLTTEYTFWLYSTTTAATVAYRAVKLELGSYSTLLNDTPPDYGEELRKCQYYFRRVSGNTYAVMGMAASATAIEFVFPFSMRQAPTCAMNGTLQALGQGGFLNLTSVNATGQTTANVRVRFNTSGATAYTAYMMTLDGYLDLSADL